MNPGKMAAQSGHIANAFVFKNVIQKMQKGKEVDPNVEKWVKTTTQGFGTQINLQVTDWGDALCIVTAAENQGIIAGKVTDPEYPYIVDNEIVGLIASCNHSQEPVCLNPEAKIIDQKWLCQRPETTGIYVFGIKDKIQDLMVKHKAIRLQLHD